MPDDQGAASVVKVADSVDMGRLGCNESAARYWALTGYTDGAVAKVCAEIDDKWMFGLVTLDGKGGVSFAVSQQTWKRQEGHYPTMIRFCSVLARTPELQNLAGSFIVWLEDGMWEWCQRYSRRAPIVAFGRSIGDHQTFLIPDAAFIGELGYGDDRFRSESLAAKMPWKARVPTIFWRGAATGGGIEGPRWTTVPRAKLALKAKEIANPQILDAKITKCQHLPPDGIEQLVSAGIVDSEVPFQKFFEYKYVVDVDGYHCAWKSLFLKLMSGSLVLKMHSPFEQWYHRGLVAWQHYIPLSADLTEVIEVYEWLLHHDREAQEIAQRGAEFIRGVNLNSAIQGCAWSLRSILQSRRSA